jgi:hypothetical protein
LPGKGDLTNNCRCVSYELWIEYSPLSTIN